MAQVTSIKLIENERNNDNIKLDEQDDDDDIDFGKLLEGMAPSNNDFEKEWNNAMTGEEFWGEIEKTIHDYFQVSNTTNIIPIQNNSLFEPDNSNK